MDSSAILRIAKEEWRYWLRAKVASSMCRCVAAGRHVSGHYIFPRRV